ncbi:MAG TPA: hypothetical protein ENN80_12220, partial [Candidatus Hydrogenedentes bacterium]|nr:hypothetical protein [Candidatus Hydrogenedentota bacterium]
MLPAQRSQKVVIAAVLIIGVFGALPATAQWTNGQNAQYVVGQPDFDSYVQNTTATGLNNPSGVAVDVVNNKLYIADTGNHRVLRYAYPLAGNQPAAELVLGQADFTSGSANAGGSADTETFNGASSVYVDSTGRLWVADSENHRVLWFNAAHTLSSNKPDADGVLGQADFTSASANRGGSTGQNSLNHPYDVHVDPSGNLWVADYDNNRVLRFDNAAAKANGANADGVLGQADFTSAGANRGGTVGQNTLDSPDGCAMCGTALFVADKDNHRVLRFDNAASKADGANADGVLGQPDFASNTGDATQSLMYGPRYVVCDGAGRLYVSEYDNSRVIVFNNAVAKANGANADFLLGQTSWTAWQGSEGQNRLYNPNQVALDSDNGWLFVADTNNRRALQFNAS